MAVSGGAVAIFIFLLVIGPIALFVFEKFVKKKKPESSSQVAVKDDEAAKIVAADGDRELVSSVDYLLGLLGYAIGIGNVWRFPFLCGRNGGAAFLIAYFTCLFLVSLPAYMVELVMGQYTRKSTVFCFKAIHPRWQGLGWAQVFMLLWVLAYYNVLLGYSCIYIMGAMADPLPWVGNDNTTVLGGDASEQYWRRGVLNQYVVTPSEPIGSNGLGPVQWKLCIGLLAVWIMVFLAVAFGKKVLAKVTWVTVVAPILMMAILLIRVALLNASEEGVAFYIGKFDGSKLGELGVWRDACVQILFSLSPGMGTAITMSSFTKPKENVYKTCWIVALCNSGFSFISGFAIFSIVGNICYKINLQTVGNLKTSLQTVASWMANQGGNAATVAAAANVMLNNIGDVTDATLKSNHAMESPASSLHDVALKLLTWADSSQRQESVLAATQVNLIASNATSLQTIAQTARSGSGLAFIAIADGMQTFGSAKNVMAVFFFMTLLTLGLDSTFAWSETMVSYLDDAIRLFRPEDKAAVKLDAAKPKEQAESNVKAKLVPVSVVCFGLFFLGLPFCTRMGLELLDTVDNYVGLMFLLLAVFLESIMFLLNFGFERFITAVRTACGVEIGPIQRVFWVFTTHFTMPVIPLCIFVWDFVRVCQAPYEGYPGWMQVFGMLLLIITIGLIPAGAITAQFQAATCPLVSQLDDQPGAKLAASWGKGVELGDTNGKGAETIGAGDAQVGEGHNAGV